MFRRFQQLRLLGDVGPVSAEPRPGFGSLITELDLKLPLHDVEDFILDLVDVRRRPTPWERWSEEGRHCSALAASRRSITRENALDRSEQR